ncbi:type VI secretion system needle sheath protein TssC [Desulfuromonas soudanensis]|uniref:Type VI secretion system needle sheath protein TssC n=1 Tax=Desulfuromonas soudanensis TaxID=1603606 RepID=A0A0M4DKD1_9BACT|nr:type VI secretion system contractile sheath large subunit [Desulfuromonas soudanensis]ALC17975.1 type VI secretion system needle sheath protein TssC [Desulfuromonas soudanensis]
MTIQESAQAKTISVVDASAASVYERLCGLVDISPLAEQIDLGSFSSSARLAEAPLDKRLTAAIQVFIDLVAKSGHPIERIDKALLDSYIAQIDATISRQLDAILHHGRFQEIESAWRGLKFLVDRCDLRSNVKVDLLDCSKADLQDDFEEAPETIQTGLYKHVYIDEYDTPGGEPVSAVVANYVFDSSPQDVALLGEVSRVAASAHAPFLASVGARFFGKESIDDLPKIHDLTNYMEKAEYLRWKGFRETEDARYVGLTLPRFLLRLPYGSTSNPVRTFNYEESVGGEQHGNYLWGNSVFAFAGNMARSFAKNGWAVNIRGPEAGGKVEGMPVHLYDAGKGLQAKIPSEILIPETRELEFANLGFIPLSYYKNSDFACFFSANSVQKATEYSTAEATANSRINARLPYIFLVSRIAHYLKVLQRENIGSSKSRQVLEKELNDWIQTLVTKMKDPEPDLIATHPLKDGQVVVKEIPENPGYFSVSLFIMPHFQIEGVDVRLSLVAQMPTGKK